MPESKISRHWIDHLMVDYSIRKGPFAMSEKHFHDECEIYLLLEGEGAYFIGDQSFPIEPGSLIFIDAYMIHQSNFDQSLSHRRLLIEFHACELEAEIAKFSTISVQQFFKKNNGIINLTPEIKNQIEAIMFSIHHEARDKDNYFNKLILMRLAELFIIATRYIEENRELATPVASRTKQNEIVKQAVEFIITNLSNQISLSLIAEHLFVNKSYLSRLFKNVTGMTIHEYINIQRVKLAQELLESSDDSIEMISIHVGYNSSTYLERVFKKYIDTTPLKYRSRQTLLKNKSRPIND